MKVSVFFVVTVVCIYHYASCNQQTDDPNRPFWATRGRRSGRTSIKAEDDVPDKWQDEDGLTYSENAENGLQTKRERASTLLASLLSRFPQNNPHHQQLYALSAWDGEVNMRKRADGKTVDPNNPFWAARG